MRDKAIARQEPARQEDHRAVERLAADLLPALIARLTSSGLAELEVREGPWKVRLRRPLDQGSSSRPITERLGRAAAGGAGGPAPGFSAGAHGATGRPSSPGFGGSPEMPGGRSSAPLEPGYRDGPGDGRLASSPARTTVTSPAVGIFRTNAGMGGSEVRAGDRLGDVDMLGIPQEIVAPVDGVVGEMLAEPGDGVEYGQPLFNIVAARPAPAEGAIPIGTEDHVAASAGERS